MHPTIAVSKKCCFCCYLLGEALRKAKGTSLTLPGTHGIVFPWVPPAGLDLSVLHMLKDGLNRELLRVVEKQRRRAAQRSLSNQSTPVSSYEDMPSPKMNHGGDDLNEFYKAALLYK